MWVPIYAHALALILVRTKLENLQLIQKHPLPREIFRFTPFTQP